MKFFMGKLLQCLTFETLKQCHYYEAYGKTFTVLLKTAKSVKVLPSESSPFTVYCIQQSRRARMQYESFTDSLSVCNFIQGYRVSGELL